jgi:hypothetical protein
MRFTLALALAIGLSATAARAEEGDEPVSSSEEGSLGTDLNAGPSKLCGKAGTCRKWNGIKCTNKSFFAVCSTLCWKKQADFAGSQCGLKAKRKFNLDAQGNFPGGLRPAHYLAEQVARGGIAARIGCKIVSVQRNAELYFGKVPPADTKSSLDKLRNVCLKGQAAGQERRGNAAGAAHTRGKVQGKSGAAAGAQGQGAASQGDEEAAQGGE